MPKTFSRPVAWLGLVLGLMASASAAASIPPGCMAPEPTPQGHAYYVDPVNGSMRGDGSRAHPWHTLAEVVADGLFATAPARRGAGGGMVVRAETAVEKLTNKVILNNPAAPIKPGDTVYLLSGDHGAVKIQGYFGDGLIGYANGTFITIAAAPGQTPVIRQLEIVGASGWIFRGLTFQSQNDSGVYATAGTSNKDYWLVSMRGPHDNIVLDGNHLQSAPDVSGWTIADWYHNRASGILDTQGSCITISNNLINRIGFGVQTQRSDKVVIEKNWIDYFSDDGIDYGSDDLLIDGNKITNSIEDGDGFHRDAMQGQPINGQAIVKDVTIQNNLVIRVTDRALPFPGYLQGIDTFDGVWQNVKVRNNVVITNAWHGISFYGANGLEISGNIVLGDGGRLLPCVNVQGEKCAAQAVVTDHKSVPTILVHASKTGAASTNVTVKNNVTTGLNLDLTNVGAIVANNHCVLSYGKCPMGIPVNGKMLWAAKPGAYGDNNAIEIDDAKGLFAAFDTENMKYDFRLKRNMKR